MIEGVILENTRLTPLSVSRPYPPRYPELSSVYNRKFDNQRVQYEDPKLISLWFKLVGDTIAKYGIIEEDIFNFDETSF
jgi:hypothetical protein